MAEIEPHDDHGNTVAAWVMVGILLVAVVIMSIAIVFPNLALFIGGVVVAIAGLIAGKVLQSAGYGKKPAEGHSRA